LEFHQELLETYGESLDILQEKFASEEALLMDEGLSFFGKKDDKDKRRPSERDSERNSSRESVRERERPKQTLSVIEQELEEKNRKLEEKIALLSHQLRMAREDVVNLQMEMVKQEPTGVTTTLSAQQSKDVRQVLEQDAVMSQFEQKVLFYLIYQFLVSVGMKLSAITFSEEIGTEVENWNQLMGPRLSLKHKPPPKLLAFYRYFYNVGPNKELAAIQQKLDAAEEHLVREQRNVSEQKDKNKELQDRLQLLQEEMLLLNRGKKVKLQKEELIAEEGILSAGEDGVDSTDHSESLDGQKDHPTTEQDRSSSDLPPPPPSSSSSQDPSSPQSPTAPSQSEGASGASNGGSSGPSSGGASGQSNEVQSAANRRIYSEIRSISDHELGGSRVGAQIMKVSEMEKDPLAMVKVVGESIPHVTSGVILSKREELLPIFLTCVRQHPDTAVRDQMTRLLFNVILKPNCEQRAMVMCGCMSLASVIGPIRSEIELLPQCWEQVNDKYEERRVLVAESCGALCAYVRSELRSSLMLSILEQLIDDKSKLVREAVARNLAHLITFFEPRDVDKLRHTQEIAFRLLKDPESLVLRTAQHTIVPALADWADGCERFCDGLFMDLFSTIDSAAVYAIATGLSRVEYERRIRQLQTLVDALCYLISRLREIVLISAPFSANYFKTNMREKEKELPPVPLPGSISYGTKWDDGPVETILTPLQSVPLQKAFDEFCMTQEWRNVDKNSWSSLFWIIKALVPKMLEALGSSDHDFDSTQIVILRFSHIISRFCVCFGSSFTREVMLPLFADEITKASFIVPPKDGDARRARILPGLIVGILSTLPKEDLSSHIKEYIINIALQEEGWNYSALSVMKSSLLILSKARGLSAIILDLLWDLVVHPTNQVRMAVLNLFDAMMDVSDSELSKKRILPALICLSNDQDRNVRYAAIKPLGTLVMNCTDQQVSEKIGMQFDLVIGENALNHALLVEVIQTFKRIISHVPSTFREKNILPSLNNLAKNNNSCSSSKNRAEMAEALFSSYRAFDGCRITPDAIESVFLPGLRFVAKDMDYLTPLTRQALSLMLRDMEGVVAAAPPPERGSSSSAPTVAVPPPVAERSSVPPVAERSSVPPSSSSSSSSSSSNSTPSSGHHGGGGDKDKMRWMDILRQTIGGEED